MPFFDAVLGFGASDEEKSAIVTALETEELRRTRWITERGKVGESMAAILLDKVRSLEPAVFAAAMREVEHDLIAQDED